MSSNCLSPLENDGQNPSNSEPAFSGTTKNHRSWSLFNGDSSQVLSKLRGESYQCVVTSPPYFWQRDYEVEGQLGIESSIASYVESINVVMEQVHRVLHREGLLFLVLGDTYYSAKGQPQGKDRKHGGRRFRVVRAVDTLGLGVPKKTAIGIPWRVALEMISRGWILRCPIIWRKPGIMPESNARDRPWRTHETVFMFSRSRSYHFFAYCFECSPRRGHLVHSRTFESRSRTWSSLPARIGTALLGDRLPGRRGSSRSFRREWNDFEGRP